MTRSAGSAVFLSTEAVVSSELLFSGVGRHSWSLSTKQTEAEDLAQSHEAAQDGRDYWEEVRRQLFQLLRPRQRHYLFPGMLSPNFVV